MGEREGSFVGRFISIKFFREPLTITKGQLYPISFDTPGHSKLYSIQLTETTETSLITLMLGKS